MSPFSAWGAATRLFPNCFRISCYCYYAIDFINIACHGCLWSFTLCYATLPLHSISVISYDYRHTGRVHQNKRSFRCGKTACDKSVAPCSSLFSRVPVIKAVFTRDGVQARTSSATFSFQDTSGVATIHLCNGLLLLLLLPLFYHSPSIYVLRLHVVAFSDMYRWRIFICPIAIA